MLIKDLYFKRITETVYFCKILLKSFLIVIRHFLLLPGCPPSLQVNCPLCHGDNVWPRVNGGALPRKCPLWNRRILSSLCCLWWSADSVSRACRLLHWRSWQLWATWTSRVNTFSEAAEDALCVSVLHYFELGTVQVTLNIHWILDYKREEIRRPILH